MPLKLVRTTREYKGYVSNLCSASTPPSAMVTKSRLIDRPPQALIKSASFQKLGPGKNLIKLIVYDFDGVMTDNRVLVSESGLESVSCNRSDGWWLRQIALLGIEQVILTTEENPVVGARAQKLKLEVACAPSSKLPALQRMADKRGLPLEAICYVGNEVNDLECMAAVGCALAPADSHPKILEIADKVLPAKGGAGVVRWVHDFLTQEKAPPNRPAASAKAPPSPHLPGDSLQGIRAAIGESVGVKQALLDDPHSLQLLERMGLVSAEAIRSGRKVLFAGNGGSFADSMHLAAEFVSKLLTDRAPLPAIALGCSNSNLTAIGNDYGYEHTFSREIRALACEGDVFFAISTSGNSPNILEAVRAALEKRVHVFGFSGGSGGKLASLCPTLCVPSQDTARIQECHIMIGHILCTLAEKPFLSPASIGNSSGGRPLTAP
jgi:D-sedoheptulose 7-phosphate isomerase